MEFLSSAVRSLSVGLVGLFFFAFFLRRIVFFHIFVADYKHFNMNKKEFYSVSAVVAFYGLRQLSESLALCVLESNVSTSVPVAERVAAACPVWAKRFVVFGLCSWDVAWLVACYVARVWGVVPSSDGALLCRCQRLSVY